MRDFLEEHFVSLILIFIGSIFALVGGGLLWGGTYTQQQTEIVQQIPLYTATELNDLPLEKMVAIEGKISERNNSNPQGLVAYIERQYQGIRCNNDDNNDGFDDDGCEEVWTLIESVTPPLWLDLPDGPVRIGNTDYELYSPSEIFQSTQSLIEGETVEYQGYRIGDNVYTIGQINRDDGLSLNVEFIYGGTYEDYLERQAQTKSVLILLGAIFLGIGFVILSMAFIAFIIARKK